ncbi:MAG TPA: extracellular solute-binding protein [Chloroflexota bacterium]|nr:extracellular solute-binding protein [Chloroflexota bacterium]
MRFARLSRLALLPALLAGSLGAASAHTRQADSTTLQVYFEGTAAAFAGQPPADRQIVADFVHDTGQSAKAVPGQDPVKILASIESGNPPDLVMLGYMRPDWLQQGAVLPLDSYLKSSHFNFSKFTNTAWNQGYLNGHYYAMTSEQDALVLLYNKDLFRKAGLDPNKPPLTLSQLLQDARKLTISNKDGSIKQLGLLPNGSINGGGADYFQLWGNLFGGSWYDQAHHKITATDPHNVQGLTWLTNFWKEFGPSRLDRFESGFGTYLGANDPFVQGKVAMLIDGDWWPTDLPKGSHLNLGGAYIPYPDGQPALAHTSAVFGDVMLIPKGSKHPDLAWKFINWYMNSEKEQLNLPATLTGYPLLKSALTKPLTGAFGNDPNVKYFEHVLLTVHGLPNPLIMPITAKYLKNLDYDSNQALHGQETPAQALAHVQQITQPELDQALRG